MISSDILARLPDQARAKVLLLDGLAADADDMARAAQGRLNNLGRQYPGAGDGNPNTVRLAAVVATQAHRHRELFDLVNNCQRWLRTLPPDAPLDVVAQESPALKDGELTAEDAVMRVRAEIGELTLERMAVAQAPEPRDAIKQAMRAQVARLAELGRPTLRSERGRAEAVFRDARADFGITPAWAAGVLCWLFPDEMTEALEELVDAALPDDAEAMTTDEQREELNKLNAEIEALGRSEEALIEAAFAAGVDILRRSGADPACVLGVRLRVAERPVRPARRPRPPFAAAPADPPGADVIETPPAVIETPAPEPAVAEQPPAEAAE